MTGWVILGLWLVVYPLFARPDRLASVHVAMVALLAFVIAPRVARRPSVTLGVPGAATLLALASLAVAVFAAEQMPARAMRLAAVTGAAHAVFFLLCLALAPAPEDTSEGDRPRRALFAILIAMVVVQAALVATAGPDDDGTWRPSGSLGNPNALGALVAAASLAITGLSHHGRRVGVLLVGLMPAAMLVVLTRSRGAVLAGGLVLVLWIARRRGWRGAALAALAGLALLVLVPNPLRERVVSLQPDSTYTRPFIWKAALDGLLENPLGIGPAMNKYSFPLRAFDAEHPSLLHQRHAIGLTHNVYLTLGLEWGWAALGAALALTAWAGARLWRARRPDPLRTGASLGAAVLLLELQWDGTEQNPFVFSAFLLLAAVALRRSTGERRGLAIPGRLAGLVTLLVGGALAMAAWDRHAEGRVLDGAARLTQQAAEGVVDAATLERTWREAAEAVPDASEPPLALARLLRNRARAAFDAEPPRRAEAAAAVAGAREALARAFAVHPVDADARRLAARLELLVFRNTDPRDPAGFVGAFERLFEIDPLDVEARWELARALLEAGLGDLYARHFAELVRLEPDYAWAWYFEGRLRQAEGDARRAIYCFVRAEESVYNCRVKKRWDHPVSKRFFEENLERVELTALRREIQQLRRRLYE